jgi:hypothetical protein
MALSTLIHDSGKWEKGVNALFSLMDKIKQGALTERKGSVQLTSTVR